MGFVLDWGGVGAIFLGESRSHLYPHMRAKFGRDPTAGSKKVSFKFIIGFRVKPAFHGACFAALIFAVLLLAALINYNSADNPFP